MTNPIAQWIALTTERIFGSTMSNHFSAAMLNFPGDDPRLDLTDVYVFASPESARKTVLIFDVNPFMTGADFHPDAVYRVNVDNDGDAHADVAFSFVFSESNGGAQTGTVYYATGGQARDPEPVGEVLIEGTPVGFDATAKPVQAGPCRLFIGVRSDPFFADGEGAFHDFQFTGDDTFAGKNILSVALEVPDDRLGPGPEIAVWATSSVRRDGGLVQVDRYGNPSLNPFFVDELKDEFNAGHPADDVANFLEPWSKLLESRGYPPAVARETVLTVLPDVMHYNRDRPAHYPNGRVLTDDVYDMRMAFLTYGRVTSDGVEPHDDYMTEFPFLGPPNAQAEGEAGTGLLSAT
jgi:Domain of unknown function (DUF4331)